MTIRLATRGSELALTQTESVARLLRERGYEAEVVAADSSGSPVGSGPGGDKARFVRTVELALLEDRADIGVHSAKDLPAQEPAELEIVAAPPREEPADAWVASSRAGSVGDPGRAPRNLDEVPQGAVVGTASVRRRSQLLARRPDLDVRPVRGNVPTRLAKLESEGFDAIVLAVAGLKRLGRGDAITFELKGDDFLPAAGQGTLVLQIRRDDAVARTAALAVGDPTVFAELLAERELVRRLEADCDSPVAATGRISGSGSEMTLNSFVGSQDGNDWIRDSLAGAAGDPEALGRDAARRLIASGAREVLGL